MEHSEFCSSPIADGCHLYRTDKIEVAVLLGANWARTSRNAKSGLILSLYIIRKTDGIRRGVDVESQNATAGRNTEAVQVQDGYVSRKSSRGIESISGRMIRTDARMGLRKSL